MIKLILYEFKSKKHFIALSIYIVMIILINFILLPLNETEYYLYFFKEEVTENFNNVYKQLFNFSSCLLIICVVFNHDKDYINNLTSFIERSSIISSKVIVYFALISVNLLIYSLITLSLSYSFDLSFLIGNIFLINIIEIWLDNVILMCLLLLFIRERNKLIGCSIFVLYIISNFIKIKSLIWFIFPINTMKETVAEPSFYYQITYILLIVALNYLKYETEEF